MNFKEWSKKYNWAGEYHEEIAAENAWKACKKEVLKMLSQRDKENSRESEYFHHVNCEINDIRKEIEKL